MRKTLFTLILICSLISALFVPALAADESSEVAPAGEMVAREGYYTAIKIARKADPELYLVSATGGYKFDKGTLFMGDSLTYHLIKRILEPEGLIGDASYMAMAGMALTVFSNPAFRLREASWNNNSVRISEEFKGLTFAEAAEKSAGKFDRIYFLLGSNLSRKMTPELYVEALTLLSKSYPDATIYVQTPPGTRDNAVAVQQVLDSINKAMEDLHAAGHNNLVLLNTNEIWQSRYTTSDGVHLSNRGLKAWYEFIIEQTVFPN